MSKRGAIGISVVDAMNSPQLFGPHFTGPSWDTWRACIKAMFAERMSDRELAVFRSVAEREPPKKPVSEAVFVIGRGGGKDSVASLIASCIAINFDARGSFGPARSPPSCVSPSIANRRASLRLTLRHISKRSRPWLRS
jgi:hypothetical protein